MAAHKAQGARQCPLLKTQHHSAQRQKKARAREEEGEVLYTAAFRTTVPPSDPELFCLFEGELDGGAARVGHGTSISGRSCRSSMYLCRSWKRNR